METPNLKSVAVEMWRYLREATGDDAYERYVAHHRLAHPGEEPLDRGEWFRRRQEQKWSGVTRCC